MSLIQGCHIGLLRRLSDCVSKKNLFRKNEKKISVGGSHALLRVSSAAKMSLLLAPPPIYPSDESSHESSHNRLLHHVHPQGR